MTAGLRQIVAAAGAIILEDAAQSATGGNRFRMHQQVRDLTPSAATIDAYVREIYDPANPPEVSPLPQEPAFHACAARSTIVDSTRSFAAVVVEAIGRKRANPGLILAFVAELSDSTESYGVLKVDFETDPRNHIDLRGDSWSLEEVEDVLPTPRADVAKYAIVPRPGAAGPASVRDVTSRDRDPAVYWLDALDVSRERTEGTLAAVANAARGAGYPHTAIASGLTHATPGTSVAELMEGHFPQIPESTVRRITAEDSRRPRTTVPDSDAVTLVWSSSGRVSVVVQDDETNVEVSNDGRTMTIELPPGAPPFDRPMYRAARRTAAGSDS